MGQNVRIEQVLFILGFIFCCLENSHELWLADFVLVEPLRSCLVQADSGDSELRLFKITASLIALLAVWGNSIS